MPASAKERITAGPAFWAAAVPVSTKMPVPMMQPMPSKTKLSGPSARWRLLSVSASACRSAQPLTEPMKHNGEVKSAQFSPDGKRIVTASGDHTARVWDAQTGQPLTELMKHEWGVSSAQFRSEEHTSELQSLRHL